MCAVLFSLLLFVQAQQPAKIPRIGYFTLSSGPSDRDEVFKRGLHELGWMDGRTTFIIEYRWVAGETEQLAAVADELFSPQGPSDLSYSPPVTQAAKNATNIIPIVMPVLQIPWARGSSR